LDSIGIPLPFLLIEIEISKISDIGMELEAEIPNFLMTILYNYELLKSIFNHLIFL
jgi:hypothetical protein